MKLHGQSGLWTLGVLVLVIGGLALIPTLAAGQQAQDAAAVNQNTSEHTSGTSVLLARATAGPEIPAASSAAPTPVPPPPPASSFSWTGIYVGASFGHGSGNADTNVNPLPTATQFVNLAPTTLSPDPSGGIYGGQVGVNWQRNWLVVGAEFDIWGSSMDGTKVVSPIIQNNGTPFPGSGNNITAHQDTSWIGSFRGRAGIAFNRVLVFGSGGMAFGHVTDFANTDFRPVGTEQYPAFLDQTKTGWIAGGGAEVAFNRHWSVKGEFLHYDLGSDSVTANPLLPLPPFQVNYKFNTTANLANFGVNFRF